MLERPLQQTIAICDVPGLPELLIEPPKPKLVASLSLQINIHISICCRTQQASIKICTPGSSSNALATLQAAASVAVFCVAGRDANLKALRNDITSTRL